MAGPILYSTNPWLSHEIATKYRKGVHFAWVCEYFDIATAPPGSAASAIAPSSNPRAIYDQLWHDCDKEDTHSDLIKRYRRTFRRLAAEWVADGSITEQQKKEIIATVNSRSWKIWRPTLYAISKSVIVPVDRIKVVEHEKRAAYGPEMQIRDLMTEEFDIIEFKK